MKARTLSGVVFGICCLLSLVPAGAAQTPKAAPIHTLNAATIFHDYCAACHGPAGKGDGPVAPALKEKVPDLTLLTRRAGGTFPRERVKKIIEGNDNVAPHGTREMPIWGPVFHQIEADQDLGNVRVDNLLRYLESLQQK